MQPTIDQMKEFEAYRDKFMEDAMRHRMNNIEKLQNELLWSNCINCKRLCNGDKSWAWSGLLEGEPEIEDSINNRIMHYNIGGFVICPDCNKSGFLVEYKQHPKRWEWHQF